MKRCIVSYSFSGNNEKLAQAIASKLSLDHIKVKEASERKVGKIMMDLFFGRTPQVTPDKSQLDAYDEVILVGPIWVQKAATPLRSYFKAVKDQNKPYSFVTISGGSLNKNPKLINDLHKRAGKQIKLLKTLYIADLLDKEDVKMEDTGNYQLSSQEVEDLANEVIAVI